MEIIGNSAPEHLVSELNRALEPGEELVWTGVPELASTRRQTRKIRMAGFIWIGLTVVWILGVGAYSWTHLDDDINVITRLSMLPLGSLVFWWPATFQRAKTMMKEVQGIAYGLTNSRILILRNGGDRSRKMMSYGVKDVRQVVAYEGNDGIGVVFDCDEAKSNVRLLLLEVRDAIGVGTLIAKSLNIEVKFERPFAD